MSKQYEKMNLKEAYFAAKQRGIDLPQHMRDTLATNNHPKHIEDARQYLISQLNAAYTRDLAAKAFKIALVTLALILILLAFVIYAYLNPKPSKPTLAERSHVFNRRIS